jgi:hypothetical protein
MLANWTLNCRIEKKPCGIIRIKEELKYKNVYFMWILVWQIRYKAEKTIFRLFGFIPVFVKRNCQDISVVWKRITIGIWGMIRGVLAVIISVFIPIHETRRRVRRFIRGDAKYEEINTKAWYMYINGDDRRALAQLCAKNNMLAAWKYYPHSFWLLWVCALYELGNYEGAAEVIKRYAEKYGTFDIYHYVLAAKCAFENDITSPEIEQAVLCMGSLPRIAPGETD